MSISLPLADESTRCADFARLNRVDPGGTALAPDVVVLVEVPEPWPKPVAKHESLRTLVGVALGHSEQVRLLAAVPHDPANPRVIAFRPDVGGMTRAERPLGHTPTGSLLAVLTERNPEFVPFADGSPRTLLVCTQGSHDVCCGTDGAQFADSFASERPDVELFRVSHTGGHRFAPTAMSLPDGRMWAYLTTDIASQIIDREVGPFDVAALCRGWWGAPTGPAQVGERAVFAARGFGLDEMARVVTVTELPGRSQVEVEVDDGVYVIDVAGGREVPTIACGAPGGEPVKPGREWSVISEPKLR